VGSLLGKLEESLAVETVVIGSLTKVEKISSRI
jgi:hypothetical protein